MTDRFKIVIVRRSGAYPYCSTLRVGAVALPVNIRLGMGKVPVREGLF